MGPVSRFCGRASARDLNGGTTASVIIDTTMRKKSTLNLRGSHELSRLLTRERLRRAGVSDSAPKNADPDLEALFERVRSVKHKTEANAPSVPKDVVRKLVGG